MKTFGENLKNLRKYHKISQCDFAKKMKTSQQRISEWECDKVEPSLYNILRIIKILDCSFEDLVDGIDCEQ